MPPAPDRTPKPLPTGGAAFQGPGTPGHVVEPCRRRISSATHMAQRGHTASEESAESESQKFWQVGNSSPSLHAPLGGGVSGALRWSPWTRAPPRHSSWGPCPLPARSPHLPQGYVCRTGGASCPQPLAGTSPRCPRRVSQPREGRRCAQPCPAQGPGPAPILVGRQLVDSALG